MKLPEPNKGQAVFLWIVGVVSLFFAFGNLINNDPYTASSPIWPALIGIAAIMVALGYRKPAP